jgi:hypothetical protein
MLLEIAQTEFLNASAAPRPGCLQIRLCGLIPARQGLRFTRRRINRQTVIRLAVDPPQQRRAPLVIQRPVEGVKRRFEQRFSDQLPVCRFPFVPVEQLDCILAHQRRPGLGIGGLFRRLWSVRAALPHCSIVSYFQAPARRSLSAV